MASALFILGAVNPLPNMDLLVSPGNQDGSRVPGWMFFFLLFVFVLHFFGWDVKAGTTEMSWGMSMIISLTVCHIMPSVCVFSTYSPGNPSSYLLKNATWKTKCFPFEQWSLFAVDIRSFSGGKWVFLIHPLDLPPRPTFQ